MAARRQLLWPALVFVAATVVVPLLRALLLSVLRRWASTPNGWSANILSSLIQRASGGRSAFSSLASASPSRAGSQWSSRFQDTPSNLFAGAHLLADRFASATT